MRNDAISPCDLGSTNSSRAPRTDSDEEHFEGLVDILLSAANQRTTSIIEANKQRLGEQPEMLPKESRGHLYVSRTNSAVGSDSQMLNEENDVAKMHYLRMRQNWINIFVVQKSETSLLLNRSKMRNTKSGGCNAYYTPNSKDLWRDQQAAASLLAGPQRQRNSKNAHSWRK